MNVHGQPGLVGRDALLSDRTKVVAIGGLEAR